MSPAGKYVYENSQYWLHEYTSSADTIDRSVHNGLEILWDDRDLYNKITVEIGPRQVAGAAVASRHHSRRRRRSWPTSPASRRRGRVVTYPRLRHGGLQYPVPDGAHPGTPYLFGERFPTADGRAVFHPVEYADPGELPDDEYPFVMCTGRELYHWHTGTMTRRSRGLDAREPSPVLELHPDDAAALGVGDGDLVRITSRRNTLLTSVRISERVARHQVFVPFHFQEAAANLLTSRVLEPYAKMAALKVCAVRIEPAGVPAAV